MKLNILKLCIICSLSQIAFTTSVFSSPLCKVDKLMASKSDRSTFLFEYELSAESAFSYALAVDSDYQRYRKQIGEKIDVNQFSLLKRQREIYNKVYGESSNEVNIFNLLIDKEIAEIRNINCVESILFAAHNKRFPMIQSHEEFSAYIFDKGEKIRILLSITKEERLGAPSLESWYYKIEKYIDEGWELHAFIHNHPFFLKYEKGDIAGTVIPSDPDIKSMSFKMQAYDLKYGLITNGLSTAIYDRNDVDILLKIIEK